MALSDFVIVTGLFFFVFRMYVQDDNENKTPIITTSIQFINYVYIYIYIGKIKCGKRG